MATLFGQPQSGSKKLAPELGTELPGFKFDLRIRKRVHRFDAFCNTVELVYSEQLGTNDFVRYIRQCIHITYLSYYALNIYYIVHFYTRNTFRNQ